jgi:hypothetical protein
MHPPGPRLLLTRKALDSPAGPLTPARARGATARRASVRPLELRPRDLAGAGSQARSTSRVRACGGCAPRRLAESDPRSSDRALLAAAAVHLPRSSRGMLLFTPRSQLDVFHVKAATTSNKRAEQSPKCEVKEREGHAAILPDDATRILAPFRPRPAAVYRPIGRARARRGAGRDRIPAHCRRSGGARVGRVCALRVRASCDALAGRVATRPAGSR